MKKTQLKLTLFLSVILLSLMIQTGKAQVVISGNSGATSDASAMLDIQSTTKGLLIPRLTTVERTGIPSPAEGLLVYDSDFQSFFIYGKDSKGNVTWYNISSNAGLWSQNGNAVYLSDPTYNVGIGTTTPTKKLVIKAENPNDTLLEIQDINGNPLMVITPQLTKFNLIQSSKGISGGFAVGRYATAKNGKALPDSALFVVTQDSTRIYTMGATGMSGGFAVGRYATAKGKSYVKKSFFTNYDSTRVYTDGSGAKGVSGGFAVGRYATAKGTQNYNFFTDVDNTRVYTGGTTAKGVSGGFAVGRYATAKGSSSNYMYMIPENYFIGHQAGDSLQNSTYTGKYNTFFGYQSGLADTSGSNNIFIGRFSGFTNTIGSNNVYLGNNAGLGNATFTGTANRNVILGDNAGKNIDDAIDNVFIGHNAGFGDVGGITGDYNVIIGEGAGDGLSSGSKNVFLGRVAGHRNSTGHNNIFIGDSTGASNTTGYSNVFLGLNAGVSNTNGIANVIIGNSAAFKLAGGDYNVILGNSAGYSITTGGSNVISGYRAGFTLTTGDNNLIQGNFAGGHITIASNNVLMGDHAGYELTTALNNVFIGHEAGYGHTDGTTGNYNVIIGEQAGHEIKGGDKNVFMGYQAGNSNVGGRKNIFIGDQAGFTNIEADNNVFIGIKAGYKMKKGGSSLSGNDNVFIGNEAGMDNDSTLYNTMIGTEAGRNSDGSFNTFLGKSSGKNSKNGYNTYIGTSTATYNETGSSNVVIGHYANFWSTGGSQNVIIGKDAASLSNGQTLGSGNVLIGYQVAENEVGISNKLYIESSNSSTPLIYGEFDTDLLRFNGAVEIADGTTAASLKLFEASGNGTNYTLFQTQAQAADITYTLPSNDGSNLNVLSTNGTGLLSWSSVGSLLTTSNAANGINIESGVIELGGSLNESTTITQGDYNMIFNMTGGGDFIVQDAGTSVFRVRDNGNVGIGTASPTVKLDVKGTGGDALRVYHGTYGHGIVIDPWNNSTSAVNIDPAEANQAIYFGRDISASKWVFQSGDVGIGTTSPDANLQIAHPNGSSTRGLKIGNSTVSDTWRFYVSSSSGYLRLYSNNSTTLRGQFNDVTGEYTYSSDRRLKDEINIIPDVLNKINKLKVVDYYFKSDKERKQKSIGLIAQDVEKVFPSLVVSPIESKEDKESYYTMNYSGFGVIAIKAIQEQQTQIEELKKENKLLIKKTEKIDDLEKQIQELKELIQNK